MRRPAMNEMGLDSILDAVGKTPLVALQRIGGLLTP